MKKIKSGKAGKPSKKIWFFSALAVIATAFLGSQFTSTGEWYESVKPAITPPDYVFPIVWTILFVLIAISMSISISAAQGKLRSRIIALFAINLALNFLWSALFFGMHLPALAFVELILLEISILALIKTAWKASKLASWLLLPYACWVAFAGMLNYLIAFG